MAVFQRFWRWLTVMSRAEWLMADGLSGVGEVVMLGAGSIERRELAYCYTLKSTNFCPTPAVWKPGEAIQVRNLDLKSVC